MGWISTGSCAAAEQLGVLVGTFSGLFVGIIIVALVVSQWRYPRHVETMVLPDTRMRTQSLLVTLPWLLAIVWAGGATYAGRVFVSCYVTHLAAAAAVFLAPVVIAVLMHAANRVGRAGIRS